MRAVIADEWEGLHFMPVGGVPADWRFRRTAVRVRVPTDAVFLDVESGITHDYLQSPLALGLSALGVTELDVATVRGRDRRVTRLISEWAYSATKPGTDNEPAYAGVRYLSRLDTNWECWAVFEDTELQEEEKHPITLDMPDLRQVSDRWDLRVF